MWEFDEAVEVRSDVVDGVETPAQFLWRGRLWRVCSVQARWTETAAWWERGIIGAGLGPSYDARPGSTRVAAAATHLDGAVASASPRSRTDCLTAPAPGGSTTALAPAGSATTGLTESPAAVGVLDADWGPRRAVFRVEAGCGRHGRRELFDLAHDPDSGRWQLERVTDR
ncbi:DUF6504 family protein [Kribbella sp. NPDC002412]